MQRWLLPLPQDEPWEHDDPSETTDTLVRAGRGYGFLLCRW
jgi:hypothetical protein